MDSLILSRITKDFLNLDPDLVPLKERYRMGWGGSSMVRHEGSKKKDPKAKQLVELKSKLKNLFDDSDELENKSQTFPKLDLPKPLENATFSPPWYFSKGALDFDQNKNLPPIPYLIVETAEIDKARAVFGNMGLFKSLCKGNGTVKQNEQGLIYLDINDRFISLMLPILKNEKLVRPPYFNLFSSPKGAHVPLILPREREAHFLDQVEGLGKNFSFTIEGLYSVQPSLWPEVDQVWFFTLESEELENFRRNHHLPPLPGGHKFQITVAIKPKTSKILEKPPIPRVHISKAFIAA